MVVFSDREEVKHWLERIEPPERRCEVAVALVARTALRVAPLLGSRLELGGILARRKDARARILSDLVLPSLRATQLSWASAKYPARANEIRAAAAVAADFSAGAVFANRTANAPPLSRSPAAADTADAAAAVAAAAAGTAAADTAAAIAAVAAAFHAATVASRSRAAVATDAADAAAVTALIDSNRFVAELAGLPLWPNGARIGRSGLGGP